MDISSRSGSPFSRQIFKSKEKFKNYFHELPPLLQLHQVVYFHSLTLTLSTLSHFSILVIVIYLSHFSILVIVIYLSHFSILVIVIYLSHFSILVIVIYLTE